MSNFNKLGFSPANILMPKDCGLVRWAVVACDQFTSQPEYWERVDQFVGDAPSALRLILPESKLESENVDEEIKKIHKTMRTYLKKGRFHELEDSMLLVERTLSNGKTRWGLLGKLDLEKYDYTPGAETLVRATEGTVLSRIPPRAAVRKGAPIELPHIMVLIDDPEKTVIEPLIPMTKGRSQLYDFHLMEDGGRVKGHLLSEPHLESVETALENLADPKAFAQRYHAEEKPVLLYAVGDGNHSLATAKTIWDAAKKRIPKEKWRNHPARYALVELVNLHDESLEFEAIHRVVFGVDPEKLLEAFRAAYPGTKAEEGEGHNIRYLYGTKEGVLCVPNPAAQLEVATLQNFLDRYLEENGGKVDYIHGEDVVRDLAHKPDTIGFLLPAMEKSKLFPTVIFDGVLPRKTFSMGEAADKRYYIEGRKIK